MTNRKGCLIAILSFSLLAGQAVAQGTGGTVVGWGSNYFGEVGDGSAYPHADRLSPAQVVGPGGTGTLTDVTGIAGGHEHSVAVKSDGTVWSWGDGTYFVLGIGGSTVAYSSPVQVLDPTDPSGKLQNVQAVSAGYYHSLALKNDGTVWGWGLNSNGQLGDPASVGAWVGFPVQVLGPDGVTPLSGITSIAAGWAHSLAVKSDGTVWAWGLNQYGELGDGTNTDRHFAVQVLGLTGVKAVAAGAYFSLALKNDGSVWAWGHNDQGTVGNCSPNYPNAPVQVLTNGTDCIGGLGGISSGVYWPPDASPGPPLTGITAIAAGVYNGMALDSSGTVWMWGGNTQGGLGDGTVGYPYFSVYHGTNPPYGTSTAIPVPGLPTITAIAAGYEAGHAVASDGTVSGDSITMAASATER